MEISKYMLNRAKGGDKRAIETIITQLTKTLGSELTKITVPGEEVGDMEVTLKLGILRAIKDYSNYEVPFATFARLSVNRALSDSLRCATVDKHKHMREAYSLDNKLYDDCDETYGDQLADTAPDLATQIDEATLTDRAIKALEFTLADYKTKLPWLTILRYKINGWSYKMIGEELGVSKKSIDNALVNIRQALKDDGWSAQELLEILHDDDEEQVALPH